MTSKLSYCAHVRPNLDYAVSVLNPYFQKDIDLIKSVQRRATKLLKEIKYLEYYYERLKRLDLTILEQRRKRGDLTQIYKMINGLEKLELVNGINFASSAFSLRGHDSKLRRELVKIKTVLLVTIS